MYLIFVNFFQEKRGSEKEQDKAPIQDFDAMVAFCEQEGWVHPS